MVHFIGGSDFDLKEKLRLMEIADFDIMNNLRLVIIVAISIGFIVAIILSWYMKKRGSTSDQHSQNYDRSGIKGEHGTEKFLDLEEADESREISEDEKVKESGVGQDSEKEDELGVTTKEDDGLPDVSEDFLDLTDSLEKNEGLSEEGNTEEGDIEQDLELEETVVHLEKKAAKDKELPDITEDFLDLTDIEEKDEGPGEVENIEDEIGIGLELDMENGPGEDLEKEISTENGTVIADLNLPEVSEGPVDTKNVGKLIAKSIAEAKAEIKKEFSAVFSANIEKINLAMQNLKNEVAGRIEDVISKIEEKEKNTIDTIGKTIDNRYLEILDEICNKAEGPPSLKKEKAINGKSDNDTSPIPQIILDEIYNKVGKSSSTLTTTPEQELMNEIHDRVGVPLSKDSSFSSFTKDPVDITEEKENTEELEGPETPTEDVLPDEISEQKGHEDTEIIEEKEEDLVVSETIDNTSVEAKEESEKFEVPELPSEDISLDEISEQKGPEGTEIIEEKEEDLVVSETIDNTPVEAKEESEEFEVLELPSEDISLEEISEQEDPIDTEIIEEKEKDLVVSEGISIPDEAAAEEKNEEFAELKGPETMEELDIDNILSETTEASIDLDEAPLNETETEEGKSPENDDVSVEGTEDFDIQDFLEGLEAPPSEKDIKP